MKTTEMHKPTPEKGKTMTAYEAVRSAYLDYHPIEAWLMLIWKGWPMRMAWQLARGESPVGPPLFGRIATGTIMDDTIVPGTVADMRPRRN